MMTPYGFSTGEDPPFSYPVPTRSIQWRPAWALVPPAASWQTRVLDAFTLECRLGVGSTVLFQHGGTFKAHILLSTRRGFRTGVPPDPDRWGTEFFLRCKWPNTSGTGYLGLREATWFVPDAEVGGAWNYHVALTAQREAAGPCFKTRFKLWVNGRNSFPPEPAMELLWDQTQSDPSWAPPDEDGQLEIGWKTSFQNVLRSVGFGVAGVDDIRLHGSAVNPIPGSRHVGSGTFTSPLYSLDVPARLKQAQWTGAVPAGGGITVQVTGYDDPLGSSGPVTLPPLGADTAISDLSAMPPVRSFRYTVRLDRPPAPVPPAMDETPIFESIWLTLRRPGTSPGWTRWASR